MVYSIIMHTCPVLPTTFYWGYTQIFYCPTLKIIVCVSYLSHHLSLDGAHAVQLHGISCAVQ